MEKTLRPTKVDRQLLAQYRRIMAAIAKRAKEIILAGLFKDADTAEIKIQDKISFNDTSMADELASIFDSIGHAFTLTVPRYSELIKEVFVKMDAVNRKKLSRALIERTGVDLTKILKEKSTQEQIQLAIDQNISLINTMLDRDLQNVKNKVYQQLRTGTFNTTELRDFITAQTGKTKRHADFIAQDQTHKFNASLTEIRHKQLDIVKYKWRNSGDRRVRGNPAGLYPNSKYNHWSREGKVYYYDRPPADGNPGQPIRCRCYAEPVLPEKFNDLLKGDQRG